MKQIFFFFNNGKGIIDNLHFLFMVSLNYYCTVIPKNTREVGVIFENPGEIGVIYPLFLRLFYLSKKKC